MNISKLQKIIVHALSDQKDILNILNSDNSLLINCTDESDYCISIMKSKHTFIHNDSEEKFADEYLATHSNEDFAKDLLNMTNSHPGFFLYYMIFAKLEEMSIIDRGLFYHLNDSIIHYEDELTLYIIRLLMHFNINNKEID